MRGGKRHIEGELLSKKELGLENLGNSQTVQTAKDAKRFTGRKAYSGQKAKVIAD